MWRMTDHIMLNGQSARLAADWAEETLLDWLRFARGLGGARHGCGLGLCGACTVLLDDQAVRACTMPAAAALGRRVTTVEGFDSPAQRAVLQAWEALAVAQCGHCQPGQMAQAAAALQAGATPAEAEAQLATVQCRCGTQPRIRAALAYARGRA